MACKEGQFDVVELIVNDQFSAFSINFNAQHVNGKTHFYFAIYSGKLYAYLVRYQIKTFLNALSLR